MKNVTAIFYGLVVCCLVWVALFELIDGAGSMSLVGLLPTIVAGLLSGMVTALNAKTKKVVIAGTVGLIVAGLLLAVILFSGRFPLGERNPIYWYWPIWFIPAALSGGILVKFGKSV